MKKRPLPRSQAVRRSTSFGMVAATAVVVLMIAGCSTGAPKPDGGVSRGAQLDSSSPWSVEFREALDSGVSDFEAKILRDGVVTTEELEDAHDRVGRCLADSGLAINYDPDGGFGLESLSGDYPDDFFERSDPVLRSCEKRADEYVTMLFEETRRNPEKLDDAKITVGCLRKAGLVGSDYTEQQWRHDYDVDEFPFNDLDPAARQCDLDPLGLWRTP